MNKPEFAVYQFEGTAMTAVLPTSWVKNGQVKYDSKKAREYIKNDKLPYKKWPSYKIYPVCDKTFDSYNLAYKAESLLLEKSDLDTTDIENLHSLKVILNKKRQRQPAPILLPSEADISSDNGSTYNSEDSSEPPSLKSIQSSTQQAQFCGLPEQNLDDILINKAAVVQNEIMKTNVRNVATYCKNPDEVVFDSSEVDLDTFKFITNSNVVTEIDSVTLASDDQIQQLKTVIDNLSSVIKQQTEQIGSLTLAVTNLSNSIKYNKTTENILRASFKFKDSLTLPLQDSQGLEDLEVLLTTQDMAEDFKSFLLQLGGTNLKTTIKLVVRELYSLQLQSKINYSGREGKYRTCNLQQTKIILEVMQLNSNKTQAEAVDEYMYHMQHVSDRIRSAKKAETRAAANI